MPIAPELVVPRPRFPAAPYRVTAGATVVHRPITQRVRVRGKFFYAGAEKFYGRGVTYGPFRPDAAGSEYHDRPAVEVDFARMAAQGINTVRTYTVPPRWLLDAAQYHGLRVLAGVPWEQHVAFLQDSETARAVEARVRAAVRSHAGHPALLGWTIGNEIPSPLVRWHGPRRIEQFLQRLYHAAKDEDSSALVTYVNYPPTEYLELPFLDFVSFNVYLEAEESLQAYVARLQNLAGERPLVMGEIGLDSRRNGEAAQARTLGWQVGTLFAEGCASVYVFGWTDEWHRGGQDIDDWDFGLTTRTRAPKPALAAVREGFRHVPFAPTVPRPFISVVICTYNGSRTIGHALEALQRVRYPVFEVIVVDDGSTDGTAEIARAYGVRLIQQTNQGLSAARNLGWQEARGTIVAYLDDDTAPDPHWLHYLAHGFQAENFVGLAGPNIAFPEDGFVAECVDHAPGNPTHVLLTDREAEHLPGCNMAFRREALAGVGGFDPRFRIAGDDVDLCWRLQQAGGRLGYHAGAMVWHHRRGSIRAFWRQQFNYGRAEGMLEKKWPEKYNVAGQLAWSGRLYDKSGGRALRSGRSRIYHGSWGTALFQQMYHPAPGRMHAMLVMPEWYLLAGLAAAILGPAIFNLAPAYAFGLWAMVFVLPAGYALRAGAGMLFRRDLCRRHGRWRLAAVTALLHWLQPIARAAGRLRQGLTPELRRRGGPVASPWSRGAAIWSEGQWRSAEQRLESLEAAIRRRGAVVERGGDWDRWDLQTRGGLLGSARLQLVAEEHGGGRQLVRIKVSPHLGRVLLALLFVLTALAASTALAGRWIASAVLALVATAALVRLLRDCGSALAVTLAAIPDSLHSTERMLESLPRHEPSRHSD